ncbi:hypothetical protein [Streptomyces niveus]|uniref:hypothetical protein n=1 Tax=Streptomyces niveus TaxID=193462 RepID=UPI003425EC4A
MPGIPGPGQDLAVAKPGRRRTARWRRRLRALAVQRAEGPRTGALADGTTVRAIDRQRGGAPPDLAVAKRGRRRTAR